MDTSTTESVFGIDASACLGVSCSLPYVRVGKSMGTPTTGSDSTTPTAVVSQTMDRSLSTPEIWRVSSKPTIQDNETDVNVLSGDNQVDVGIRPELDNIRVNLCSCLVSVKCCAR